MAHLGLFNQTDDFLLKHGQGMLARLAEIDVGDLGVSIFFVISGFLITTLLLRYEDRSGRISLKDFYVRRFFRIFPPYYFYLLVVGLLWAVHLVPMLRGALISAALYGSNYYPYWRSQPAGAGWLVGHTWSLSLEEQFYLVWPACLHWLGRKRSTWLGLVLLLLGPLSRLATLHFAPGLAFDGQSDRMFHSRIDTIMAGCVLALLGTWPRVWEMLLRGVSAWWTGGAALLLLFATLHAGSRSVLAHVFGIGVEAVLLAYLVLYAIHNAERWSGRLLNHPWLRHLGLISYSLYLWQQLFLGPVNVTHVRGVLRLGMILLAAELSYQVVEKGSFRVRDWFLARNR